jgi:hypothetical protein
LRRCWPSTTVAARADHLAHTGRVLLPHDGRGLGWAASRRGDEQPLALRSGTLAPHRYRAWAQPVVGAPARPSSRRQLRVRLHVHRQLLRPVGVALHPAAGDLPLGSHVFHTAQRRKSHLFQAVSRRSPTVPARPRLRRHGHARSHMGIVGLTVGFPRQPTRGHALAAHRVGSVGQPDPPQHREWLVDPGGQRGARTVDPAGHHGDGQPLFHRRGRRRPADGRLCRRDPTPVTKPPRDGGVLGHRPAAVVRRRMW